MFGAKGGLTTMADDTLDNIIKDLELLKEKQGNMQKNIKDLETSVEKEQARHKRKSSSVNEGGERVAREDTQT
jgi:hypothetical protein